ncbi:MAG: cupin domain-containing protein [Planctomycetes bacterium]|nr:cupin domain-containing protein [Planctomycetota bacterium]
MLPSNLFDVADPAQAQEVFEPLVRGGAFTLERIVSTGQSTPAGHWYDGQRDEWVVLLSGAAVLKFAAAEHDVPLKPGDYVLIPAHCRHRVEWTDPSQPSVWLALHFDGGQPPR